MTEAYLSVTFTIGEQGARRLYQVKVPMDTLASMEGFLRMLDKAIAIRLRDAWDSDEPLVLVGAECPPWPHAADECEGCQAEHRDSITDE